MASIGCMVHAIDKHRRIVFRWGRENDFLRARSQMLLARILCEEQASSFQHHICADLIPFECSRVFLSGQANLFAIDHERVAIHADRTFEATMHAVVLQHVGQVIGFEQIVDAHDLDVRKVLHRSAKHHAANAAKSVDA